MSMHIFNPEHDLAMASDFDNFDAPLSAKEFARDLAYLPIWYAQAHDSVFVKEQDQAWMAGICKQFPKLSTLYISDRFKATDLPTPWGWDKTIRRTFEKNGVVNLPTREDMEWVRRLSHRELSIEAMKHLASLSCAIPLAKPAILLQDNEIEGYIQTTPYAIFKAPWSGSGKGICRSLGCLSENLLNRVKNMAKKQGSVLAESLYHVVQNFAMEFLCENGTSSFVGYSWFSTSDNGAYLGNLLATNEHIQTKLNQWITTTDLNKIQESLLQFIEKHVAPHYSGYLGVDMFIYETEQGFAVHPCVEINVRMTMGLVARLFYDTFVEEGKTGVYFVDYYKNSNDLFNNDLEKTEANPLVINNERIQKGYLSLTPISRNTLYRARVEII